MDKNTVYLRYLDKQSNFFPLPFLIQYLKTKKELFLDKEELAQSETHHIQLG